MNSSQYPLRYKISSWKQLPQCKSNNDRDFRITVTEFVQNLELSGLRISVVHPKYGVLFSEVLESYGSFITNLTNTPNATAFELDSNTILQELNKFGFCIAFEPRAHLPMEMCEYLNTLAGLKFDKIRVLHVNQDTVNQSQSHKWYVVGFMSCKHPRWLSNVYVASKEEFTDALVQGSAINISEMDSAKGFDWKWLDFVANIEDVLKDNMEALIQ